jgi:hypothetical protein
MDQTQNDNMPKHPMAMGTVVTLTILLGLLVLAGAFLLVGWEVPENDPGSHMSTNGYIAMALGTIVTMALGAGLMFLMFYSNRHDRD